MRFQPLEVIRSGDSQGWVAGAEHATRDDGSSSLMVGQVYSLTESAEVGTRFTDHLGQVWISTHALPAGLHFTGIILEAEGDHVRHPE